MKKIFFALISLLIFNTPVFGDFDGNWTDITEEVTFSKIHGVDKLLYVYEDYVINPFSSATILRNTLNGGNCNYTVNGIAFSSSSFFITVGKTEAWETGKDGIITQIEYLENTYVEEPGCGYAPNQSVKIRKYYQVPFSHDTTPPVCGDLKLYNDYELKEPFSYSGGWLNTSKYYTLACEDPESGCKLKEGSTTENNGKVLSVPTPLGHGIEPTFRFENNVDLASICTGALLNEDGENITIMYDEVFIDVGASFEKTDLEFWREENRTLEKKEGGKYYYSIVKTMEKKSNTGVLSIEFKDNTSIDSMHGASGVRSYSINVFKNELSNTSSNYSNIIYNKSDNFPIYNPDGTKTESDVKNIVLSDLSLTKSGRYQMIISAYDWAGNETKVTFYYIIYPTDEGLFDLSSRKGPNNTPEFYTLNKSLDGGDKYANNSDYYQYTLVLRDKFGNFISNKNITNLTQSCNGLSSCEEITFDMVDREGGNATTLTPNKTTTDVNGEYKFNLKSYTPGTFSEVFQIKLYGWGDDFTEFTNKPITGIVGQPSNSNIFKSPFNLKEIVVLENDGKPIMGKQLMYNVGLEIVSGKIRNTENGILEISRDSVKPISSGHIWNQTSSGFILESSTNFILNNGVLTPSEFKISGIIGIGASSPDQALAQINVSTTNLPISYNLDGKSVRYSLNDVNVVGCEDISTLGVKVVGTVQGSGINQSAGLEENFSDLSKSEARAKIRQNAYTLVRNMINNQVLNGVKYVEGDDIRISGDLGYETLIVKNGNVIITGDLNTSKNKLGIIVLKDGYDVIEDWDYLGNVYVSNTVKEINAIIYADGALRSADENGNSYGDEQLGERLTIEGSLFTRNTIGGIIGGGVSMTLPGGQKTDDYELASVYDLNYIRKTPICSADDYSLLIKYNPSIITNPPKGFTTN